MQSHSGESSNNLNSSNLGQRLQRRLVKPVGVINTQQLHCHYQATQGMSGQLIQRLALPEQVKFRYGSGVLQPQAMFQNVQRQRRESVSDFEGQYLSGFAIAPEANSPKSSTTVQRSMDSHSRQRGNTKQITPNNFDSPMTQKTPVMTKTSGASQKNGEISRSPVKQVKQVKQRTGVEKTQNNQQPMKINRQATFNALLNQELHPRQGSVTTQTTANPQLVQTQLETGEVSSLALADGSKTLRISRKARNLADISEPKRLNSTQSQDLPLAKVPNQLTANSGAVQTKINTSNELGRIKQPQVNSSVMTGIIQNKASETNSSTVRAATSPKQPLALGLQKQQIKVPIQRSPKSAKSAIALNPTIVTAPSNQLANSSKLPLVQPKNLASPSSPDTYSQQMPLAKAPISNRRAIASRSPEGQIARQTQVGRKLTGQSTMSNQTSPMMPMSSPEKAAQSVDINQVAEQVSRILARQLKVERERRGLKRWH